MDILPSEVDSIKVIGKLFGDDVKMVKTHGGFHVAIGKKKKSGNKAEALAGGSHQAIVAHQLTKDFGSDFEPSLAKSESDRLEDVENKTEYLPASAIESGVELYTLSKNNKLEFILYKRGITLGRYVAEARGNALVLKKHEFKSDMFKSDKKTAEAMSRAMRDKMAELNLSKIEKGWL